MKKVSSIINVGRYISRIGNIAPIFLGTSLFMSTLAVKAQEKSDNEFKPKVKIGVLAHTYVSVQQNGFDSSTEVDDADSWTTGANLYRARLLMNAQLTERDAIYVATEMTASIGLGADKTASMKIVDAQIDHKFCDELTVSAGKILVSHNRNGLQGASNMMANDFGYFQYPYNSSKDSPLQNDGGRDIGVNLSGGFFKNKLKYRLGGFSGRREFEGTNSAPIRVTGRLEYNFMDIDQYAGTNLGIGKTVTIAGGVDTQGTYFAAGGDAFIDYPLCPGGSITANLAYSYLTGGNDPNAKYSFADLIPEQDIWFAELGYYIKSCKLQPWVKFERQNTHTKATSSTVYGGGINWFFNGFDTNLRLSYIAMEKGVTMNSGEIKNKTYGQFWLQLQFYLF